MERGASVVVAGVILVAALAGCAAPAGIGVESSSATGPTPWEQGLADHVETPDLAPRRSASERLANTEPPGSPRYAAFDLAFERFMESYGIEVGSIAVLRDGELRYANTYGAPADAMLRIASVTKPMTAAVVTMLVEEGILSLDAPVFCVPPAPNAGCLLAIAPHEARPIADGRIADITVEDLLLHRTGWTRDPCTAPTIGNGLIGIARDLDIPTPPPAWRIAQWQMGAPLEFAPGTTPPAGMDAYCNMGYLLLGLAAEAATSASMAALYDAYLFRPLEIAGDIKPGHTEIERRDPREPAYACDRGKTPSVFDPSQEVCFADGGFDLDSGLAIGGLIATATSVGAVYEVFENNGAVRDRHLVEDTGHGGSLPGTEAIVRRFHAAQGTGLGDLQVVFLLNKEAGEPGALPPQAGTQGEHQDRLARLLAALAGAEGIAIAP